MHTSLDTPTDQQLLERYVKSADQDAFAELAGRHIHAIYAAARRQVRDADLAEEVVQTVLLILVRRAGGLQRCGTLAGWLHKVTWFTSRAAVRSELRRMRREQKVQAMTRNCTEEQPVEAVAAWNEVAPVLDDAIAKLSDAERGAIVLRFLEERALSEVAQMLGISEAAATKRVSRGLENLRRLLARRGMDVSASGLSAALLAGGRPSAPVDLLPKAVRAALASKGTAVSTAATSSTTTLLKGTLMAMAITKIKIAVAVAIVCLLAITSAVAVNYARTSLFQAPAPAVVATPTPATSTWTGSETPEFMKFYGLEDGQIFKRIVDAPADIRGAYMQKYYHHPVGAFFIGWQGNQRSGSENWDPGYRLIDIITMTRVLSEPEVEGDPQLLHQPLTGDIAFNPNVTNTQYCAALSTFLKTEYAIDVNISLQRVPRKVIVLRGEWNYQALPDAPSIDEADLLKGPCVEVYIQGPLDLKNCFSNGQNTPRGFAGILGTLIHEQVVIDRTAMGLPREICDRIYGANDERFASNRDAVLQHVSEQTGLSWTEETRTVKRLMIEKNAP